jgi:hypothetical protein
MKLFSAVNFLRFLVIKTLDLDPDPHGQNSGSGSAMKPMRIHNNAEKRRPAGLVKNKKPHDEKGQRTQKR